MDVKYKLNTPVNRYSFFDNYTQNPASEQELYQNLTDEQINLYGTDIYYMPRERVEDEVISDITFSYFNIAIQIKSLLQNDTSFQGEQEFITSYDVEIKDELRFYISTRQWDIVLLRYAALGNMNNEDAVKYNIIETKKNSDGFPIELMGKYRRPIEGDLLYFPLINDLHEIKYVQEESPFYQFGKIQFYELKTQIYSNVGNEKIEIHIPELKSLPEEVKQKFEPKDENNDNVDDELGYELFDKDEDGYNDDKDFNKDGITDKETINNLENEISPSNIIKIFQFDSSINFTFAKNVEVYVRVRRRVGTIIREESNVEATAIVDSFDPVSRELTLVQVDGIFNEGKTIYSDESSTGWRVESSILEVKNERSLSSDNEKFNAESTVDFTEDNPLGLFNPTIFN